MYDFYLSTNNKTLPIPTTGNYPELKEEMRAMGMNYDPFIDTRGN